MNLILEKLLVLKGCLIRFAIHLSPDVGVLLGLVPALLLCSTSFLFCWLGLFSITETMSKIAVNGRSDLHSDYAWSQCWSLSFSCQGNVMCQCFCNLMHAGSFALIYSLTILVFSLGLRNFE